MADNVKKSLDVTVGGKPLSPEASSRVREALKRTLEEQLKKEGQAVKDSGAAGDVSGHGRW